MQYSLDQNHVKISRLGFGCMRFTQKGNEIDFDKAEKEILTAIENGVNYFDTAYIYTGSEEFLGKVITKNQLRDRILLATKLPHYLTKNIDSVEKTFREELKRLQTDYIDYYLIHMLTDISEWSRLVNIGIIDWIEKHKKDGSIRNIGFSFHGNTEMFLKILDAYPWNLCLVQYNYYDEVSQAGKIGVKEANKRGIPVFIMEPLRGGKLVNLPENAMNIIHNNNRQYSSAEWGLRWLWNHPEITCVLSGMNSTDMVLENTRIASECVPGSFSNEDYELIEELRREIKKTEIVNCTGCGYCMPCPMGIDIPRLFHYYNLTSREKLFQVRFEYARNVGMQKFPGFGNLCIRCGKCEMHCPQSIPIRKMVQNADRKLSPWPYKLGMKIARHIILKD